ncbi:NAD(P)-dependent alcohol dehydrogenase [Ekhidna sp. To15]|uniref:NAD(P)-dependent alcohol dehydrogenase n=1 Tax=Ekhidna sp. To15 TaxID=3395267 RepID=UPI003F51D74F
MKAIHCTSYGPVENLKLVEVEKPSPKANEVLIKVHCSAVNDYDWSMVRGKPGVYRLFFGLFKPKRPILGMELSGTIEGLGEEASNFKIGDAVYGDISDHGFGSFAEYICINEKAVVRKPEYMSFEDAAALSHAANLAWQGLVDVGQISNGMGVLINGAGGGVGTLGLYLAKTYDAKVTGVDTGDKLKAMAKIGFDHILDYKQTDFTKEKERYDLILDAKTSRPPNSFIQALSPKGKYVSIGGEIKNLLQLAFARKIRKKPVYMVGLKANKDLDKIHPLYEKGLLKPVVDGPYPLEKTPWAIQHFGDGLHTGKVIISMLD